MTKQINRKPDCWHFEGSRGWDSSPGGLPYAQRWDMAGTTNEFIG